VRSQTVLDAARSRKTIAPEPRTIQNRPSAEKQTMYLDKFDILVNNIGSMSGFIVNRPQDHSYFNASKAAVHHLTKSLAAEWGDRGVRVNAVAPTISKRRWTRS
jgi:NAD(P)-dependent dehydrogenase (short-subunit alcohol dehydrogenase family)